MKKYTYASHQLSRWQKYGIQKGIIFLLKNKMRSDGLDINEWKVTYDNCYTEYQVTFIIPTPNDKKAVLDYPYFEYDGDLWYIDMIHFDDELQIHLMGCFGHEDWKNGGWHTVRESLNLDDTMLLYEYISDRLSDLLILSKEQSNDYNSSGALGVGMF